MFYSPTCRYPVCRGRCCSNGSASISMSVSQVAASLHCDDTSHSFRLPAHLVAHGDGGHRHQKIIPHQTLSRHAMPFCSVPFCTCCLDPAACPGHCTGTGLLVAWTHGPNHLALGRYMPWIVVPSQTLWIQSYLVRPHGSSHTEPQVR